MAPMTDSAMMAAVSNCEATAPTNTGRAMAGMGVRKRAFTLESHPADSAPAPARRPAGKPP